MSGQPVTGSRVGVIFSPSCLVLAVVTNFKCYSHLWRKFAVRNRLRRRSNPERSAGRTQLRWTGIMLLRVTFSARSDRTTGRTGCYPKLQQCLRHKTKDPTGICFHKRDPIRSRCWIHHQEACIPSPGNIFAFLSIDYEHRCTSHNWRTVSCCFLLWMGSTRLQKFRSNSHPVSDIDEVVLLHNISKHCWKRKWAAEGSRSGKQRTTGNDPDFLDEAVRSLVVKAWWWWWRILSMMMTQWSCLKTDLKWKWDTRHRVIWNLEIETHEKEQMKSWRERKMRTLQVLEMMRRVEFQASGERK